jgi:hypothetical protein
MPPLVVPPAAAVSRQWQSERQADTAPPPAPAGTPQVHWYAPQREAIRLLRAALQGTQHKAHRGQGGDEPTGARETTRVPTAGWRVEPPTGGVTALTAGGEATGQEVSLGTARGRWQRQQDAAARSEPLPRVARTDGVRTMRRQWVALWGQPVPGSLAWYHRAKTMGELMGRGARPNQEQAVHGAPVLDSLWHGRPEAALPALRREGQAQNPEALAAVMTYLEKPREERIADGRRPRAGQPLGRGRREKGGDQVIGVRQKPTGMRWSPTGRTALGI